MTRITSLLAALFALSFLTACEPEVGSPDWCKAIKDKGVENVTAKEAAEFAKSCVF